MMRPALARPRLARAIAACLALAGSPPAAAWGANSSAKPAAKPAAAAAVAPFRLLAAPGLPDAALRSTVLQPFAQAARLSLTDTAWPAGGTLTQALAAGGADLALLDGASWNAACAAGLLAAPPPALTRDAFIPGGATACGIAVALTAQVMAWDTAKLKTQPSWADFFNVARIPGRRGLARDPRGTLEVALLADGAGAGEVYKLLRTPEGTERAFRKLDQLRPYIAWWTKPAEPAALLANHAVALTTAPAAAIAGLRATRRSDFALSFDGAVFSRVALAVPKAARDPELSWLAVTAAADPLRQLALARATGLAPARLASLRLLGAELAESPSSPANLKRGLDADEGFWQENGARLAARFAAFLAK